MLRRCFTIVLSIIALTPAVLAQSWADSYDSALRAARDGDWAAARAHFIEARTNRSEDQARATNLPGPVTEPRVWRGGAPYSPNFGMAYSAYRLGLEATDDQERTRWMQTAQGEFEELVAKNQLSRESLYFLSQIYSALRNVQGQSSLEEIGRRAGAGEWRVDTAFLAPEEVAVITRAGTVAQAGSPTQTGTSIEVRAGQDHTVIPSAGTEVIEGATPALIGSVPTLLNKFAIVIGNSTSMGAGESVTFASQDALLIRESLILHAGYDETNVTILTDATAQEMHNAIEALAERIPEDATLFIFFAGNGVNVGGRDFLAGIDAEFATDTDAMIAKNDIYQRFLSKGAQIFAFYEVSRPIVNGYYFGSEVPQIGRISQAHATIAGENVYSIFSGGTEYGLYAKSMADIMAGFRVNRIPVVEYIWQVFTKMRGSEGPRGGSGSRQTPTIPVVINMENNPRF